MGPDRDLATKSQDPPLDEGKCRERAVPACPSRGPRLQPSMPGSPAEGYHRVRNVTVPEPFTEKAQQQQIISRVTGVTLVTKVFSFCSVYLYFYFT